mmetsp:Transcript_100631/g.290677  ORF Transcript_100631/g.290677 Transcript_100631/m.290677 type:complete len:217 (-) Transcript_100631:650-1300(-)
MHDRGVVCVEVLQRPNNADHDQESSRVPVGDVCFLPLCHIDQLRQARAIHTVEDQSDALLADNGPIKANAIRMTHLAQHPQLHHRHLQPIGRALISTPCGHFDRNGDAGIGTLDDDPKAPLPEHPLRRNADITSVKKPPFRPPGFCKLPYPLVGAAVCDALLEQGAAAERSTVRRTQAITLLPRQLELALRSKRPLPHNHPMQLPFPPFPLAPPAS